MAEKVERALKVSVLKVSKLQFIVSGRWDEDGFATDKSQNLSTALALNSRCCQTRDREKALLWTGLWFTSLVPTLFFFFNTALTFLFPSSQGFMSLFFVETDSTRDEKRILNGHGWVTAAGKAYLMQITTFHFSSESPAANGKEKNSHIYI